MDWNRYPRNHRFRNGSWRHTSLDFTDMLHVLDVGAEQRVRDYFFVDGEKVVVIWESVLQASIGGVLRITSRKHATDEGHYFGRSIETVCIIRAFDALEARASGSYYYTVTMRYVQHLHLQCVVVRYVISDKLTCSFVSFFAWRI